MMNRLVNFLKTLVPSTPSVGQVNFGDLRRLTPLCNDYGYQRGGPVDRYYIEEFLAKHVHDIQGHVLELNDDRYTKKFGGTKVTKSDILDINRSNPLATVIADLTQAENIPSNTYDCIILTQVLELIYDLKASLHHLHRILKPGGVLLITLPGVSHFKYKELSSSWCWTFSEFSVRKLLLEFFPEKNITTDKHGNVLVAASFLYGLGVHELNKEEYDFNDPNYQVIIEAKAVKE